MKKQLENLENNKQNYEYISDKYIPGTIESEMDHYLSSEEEVDEKELEHDYEEYDRDY